MGIIYPLPNRNTINLHLPTFTLDVNQVALQPPTLFSADLRGLVNLEWNYFEPHSVELCVTPESEIEITQGTPVDRLGSLAYRRFLKSGLYKSRPPQAILTLSFSDSEALWIDMRQLLFPTVTDDRITSNQIADVNQIFLHTISSGSTASNSAFVTLDGNFLGHADNFQERYGVTILPPNDAWSIYQPEYKLAVPTESQSEELWHKQQELFVRIQAAST